MSSLKKWTKNALGKAQNLPQKHNNSQADDQLQAAPGRPAPTPAGHQGAPARPLHQGTPPRPVSNPQPHSSKPSRQPAITATLGLVSSAVGLGSQILRSTSQTPQPTAQQPAAATDTGTHNNSSVLYQPAHPATMVPVSSDQHHQPEPTYSAADYYTSAGEYYQQELSHTADQQYDYAHAHEQGPYYAEQPDNQYCVDQDPYYTDHNQYGTDHYQPYHDGLNGVNSSGW